MMCGELFCDLDAVLPPGGEFRGGVSLRSGPGDLCPGGAGVPLLSSSKLAALPPA